MTSGLGARLYAGGTDISGDASAVEISSPLTTADVTNLAQSAAARQFTFAGGLLHAVAFFNPSGEHPALKTLPVTDVPITFLTNALSHAAGAGLLAKQANYDPIRGADGSLTFAIDAWSTQTSIEWGNDYTGAPSRTDSAATNGTGINDGVTTTFGFTAYLHAFAFSGTSATVTVQHSADNGVSDAWTALLSFAVVASAPGAQRVSVAGTVKSWIRVVTSGTFSNLVFHVLGIRIAGAGVAVDAQIFTSSGTWTKPAGATVTFVVVIGGGGGGGRGLANNAALAGSSGGGGGAYSDQFFPTSALGATETVTVGAGGAGAPLGGSAGSGGVSKFGAVPKVTSGGGAAGLNASNSLRTGGTGGFGLFAGSAGGDGALSSFGGNGVTLYSFAAAGGGAGGGTDTVPTAYNGGSGGAGYQTNLAGAGALGAVPGGNGGDAAGATPNTPGGGQGGGGGASNIAGNAGNGGAGGIYGGGGGGGGSCKTGSTAGIGGAGAGGIIVVISW